MVETTAVTDVFVRLKRHDRTFAPELTVQRCLDFALALIAFTFFLPLVVLVAMAIKLGDGGPILFRQTRIGRHGQTFTCLKFRSMAVDADARLRHLLENDPQAYAEWSRDHKLRNDPRITRLGNFLRKSSLDELPQLLNVLRGEMSLVGPRPIVAAEISRYGHYFRDYCRVLPGITGIWQISGRNDVHYRRRVAMDVAYARSRKLSLYLSILAATLPAVLLRRGSY